MRRFPALFVLLLMAACSGGGTTGSPLEQFAGTHTKAVWVQSDGTDPFALGTNLLLMGVDSPEGQERRILAERGSYMKPMITPDGGRIVFSRGHAAAGGPEIFVVNWDGSGLASLGKGFAVSLWEDPADSTAWVYAGRDAAKDSYDFPVIERFRIDRPSAREVVWNKTLVSADTFQVSPDGRHAGGLFPWPEAGVAELPNGNLEKLGDGCWTALASVRGPVMWYFDGAHRNLTMVDIRTERRWMVNINGVPGFGNDEVYHPRWTNHPRFMVMSGPYNLGGDNQVRSGGTQTEVYLGRFSEDYSRIEAWHRITNNEGADSYPDVWIDRSDSPHRTAVGPIGPASAAPGNAATASGTSVAARAVIDARFVKAAPVPSPASIEPYRHALLVHEYDVTRVVEGTYTGDRILVAQWVIRDRQVLPDARRQPGTAHRLIVERFDAHPELEGERVISAGDTPRLPLYYEVK